VAATILLQLNWCEVSSTVVSYNVHDIVTGLSLFKAPTTAYAISSSRSIPT